MSAISMKQLLEAGVHFGHQTRRWNPKMAPYIFTARNGIHIIDLQKSVGKVDEAYNALSNIVKDGGTVLFVGTKKQAQEAIKEEALRCGEFYVDIRWLGGMLTNFKTIESRIKRLKDKGGVLMSTRNERKSRVGVVVSDKMQKTIVVSIQELVQHKLYKKSVKRTVKFLAHDENNDAHIGDKVQIMETRPLSKLKRWRLVQILEKAK